MINDQFGIISRNAEMRLRYGHRVAHGKVATPPPPPPGVLAATVNPFERVKPGPAPEPERQLAAVLPPRPIPPGLTIATVLAVAVTVTGVPLPEMQGRSRVRKISHPRQFAYWLLREKIAVSFPKIGHPMKKNYASVFVGIRKTRKRLAAGHPLFVRWRDEAEAMIERLGEGGKSREHSGANGHLSP
jgi:hypothetical protein